MSLLMNAQLPFAPGEGNAGTAANAASAVRPRFVFCSDSAPHGRWLGGVLHDWEPLQQRPADLQLVVSQLVQLEPQVVFLDFTGEGSNPDAPGGFAPAELAAALARSLPEVPLVALGTMARPESAIAALRAGVHDFIDLTAPSEDARETVLKALMRVKLAHQAPPTPVPPPASGKLIALLGTRAGVGTSTLAAHLADLAQARCAAHRGDEVKPPISRVAVLDLGLPAGDGQLYLNAGGNFHFVDAVQNLRRFDDTFINTALSRSDHGVTVIPLPRNLGEMREVAHADALALLQRLRQYFDVLLVDLGGFSNIEFVTAIKNAADEAWLVTDQSVGALVSLSNFLHDLHGQQRISCANLRLIVNRHDERYGMAAPQIAERFDLPLLAAIPDATLGLMSSSSQGKLLHHVARRDPYVLALEQLADALVEKKVEAGMGGGLGRWLPKLGKR